MSDPDKDPFLGILPGSPKPYWLKEGEGEKSVVFDTLFTILLSGDETENQYGAFTTDGGAGERIPAHFHPTTHEIFYIVDGKLRLWLDDQAGFSENRVMTTGDFAFIPKGVVHAFQLLDATRVFGVGTGGFERFFHGIGQPTEQTGVPAVPYIPTPEQFMTAGQRYGTVFLPEFRFQD